MTEVAFDLPKHYPPVEPEDFVSGYIQSEVNPELCVENKFSNKELKIAKCSSGNDQKFFLSWRKVGLMKIFPTDCKNILSGHATAQSA